MILKYIVDDDVYLTLNQLLKEEFLISKRLLTKLIKNNKVLLNGYIVDTRAETRIGDVIEVDLSLEEDNSNIIPAQIKLDIIFEDDGLLVVNKPAGIAIHPSMRYFTDSLSNGIKYYFDQIGLKKKIRPVNRLDFNTSGLVVFVKNEYIQECLIKQMKKGVFQKQYLCIVDGKFDEKMGTINLPIARKENSIIERCVNEIGKPAITHYEVIKEYSNYSIVKCLLETGRTHQIRVHMACIGHPLIGDSLYGSESNLISRQALHCYKLSFINPFTKNFIKLKCNLPGDFEKVIIK